MKRLQQQAADFPTLNWERPEDLSRISMESLWSFGREVASLPSTGCIHISADHEYQSHFSAIGNIFTGWQRLVTATGAAKLGITSAFSQLPSDLVSKTRLKLLMDPMPGSLVLEFGPVIFHEISSNGRILEQDELFVNECITESLDLVQTLHEIAPGEEENSEFLSRVNEGGPVLATAIQRFAKGIEADFLDVEMEWREPNKPTKRTSLNRGDAVYVKQLLVPRTIPREDVTLRGELETLSTKTLWQMRLFDGNYVSIDSSHLSADIDVTQFHLKEDITVVARPIVKRSASGRTSTVYKAITVFPTRTA